MNYKLEKFWNKVPKIFEEKESNMNYKLEKFWNYLKDNYNHFYKPMNYKLEKFWNFGISSLTFIRFCYEL